MLITVNFDYVVDISTVIAKGYVSITTMVFHNIHFWFIYNNMVL